jgi:hypothetical protein
MELFLRYSRIPLDSPRNVSVCFAYLSRVGRQADQTDAARARKISLVVTEATDQTPSLKYTASVMTILDTFEVM